MKSIIGTQFTPFDNSHQVCLVDGKCHYLAGTLTGKQPQLTMILSEPFQLEVEYFGGETQRLTFVVVSDAQGKKHITMYTQPEEETKVSNPPYQAMDGVYAGDARSGDYATLLDHFAGLAMQGICARTHAEDNQYTANGGWIMSNMVALSAYEIAKAMLEERQKHIS